MQRSMDRMTSATGQFLFVNKDATNVGSRTTVETYNINSHVQRHRKYSVQERSTKPKGSLASDALCPDQSTSNIVKGQYKWRIAPAPISAQRRRDGGQHGEMEELVSEADSSRELVPTKLRRHQTLLPSPACPAEWAPSPFSILMKGNSDPFDAAALPISPKANESLKHAREVGGLMIWPAESISQGPSPIIRAWWEEVRNCIEDAVSLRSFLAYATTLKAVVHKTERATLMAEAAAHKLQSLSFLRAQMSNSPPNLRTLAVVVHLFGAEFYTFDFVAAMTHLKAVKYITEALGGLMSLPQVHRELILTMDVVLASICLSRPLFDIDEWDPGSVKVAVSRASPTDNVITHLAATMYTRSAEHVSLEASVDDPALRSMMTALRELFDVEDYKLGMSHPDDKIFRWVHLRKIACRARLLNYYIDIAAPVNIFEAPDPSRRRDSTSNEKCIEACLSVASIYAEAIVFGNPSLPSAHARFAGLLQKTFLVCLQELGVDGVIPDQYVRPIFWAVTMGAIDELRYQGAEPARHWHTTTFTLLARRMGLWAIADVISTLEAFVYDARVMDGPVMVLLSMMRELQDDE